VDEDQETLLTRRRLLAAGAVMVASAALPESASAKRYTAGLKKAKPLKRYTRKGLRRSRFDPHIGTRVQLRGPGGAVVPGKLAGVEDVPYVKGLAGDQDAYTLRFRGPVTPRLPEGIASIRSTRFGMVALYVTAVPTDGLSQDYLAVVNRRVPRSARRARPPVRKHAAG
jgi:hypothetical protein